MNHILYQQDRVPIRTYSKNVACGAFCFIKDLAHGAVFPYKFVLNWDAFDLKFLILSTNSLVVKII